MTRTSPLRALRAAGALALLLATTGVATAQVPGGTLDPTTVPKYGQAVPILPPMPRAGTIGGQIDYYEIAVRQFEQQMLPPGLPKTPVWGYGAPGAPSSFHTPARTIEATVDRPARVKWINDLKDASGGFLPHLLPVDQTLHWANPAQDCVDGTTRTDCRGRSQAPYRGPVPLVTHLHGAHVGPESDGYPEAWYLPDATDIPTGYAAQGAHYGQIPSAPATPGAAVYQYPNDQRSSTLWYHDHTLGVTRANVYAGLAGAYLLRASSDPAGLPGPAPQRGDRPGTRYFEIPLIIQDKSFNADGSLFYPADRAFFEGLATRASGASPYLDVPFAPDAASGGASDVSPIWNPEFFGNTMLVNGKTWPRLTVEARRYRFRIVNASDTRVLILKVVAGDPTVRPATAAVPIWQVGADGGFLPRAVALDRLLVAPGERADVVVDFSAFAQGTPLYLINEGPDEPFGGGTPGTDFAFADPGTTGQVMKFMVIRRSGADSTTAPQALRLPARSWLGTATTTRRLSLNEAESATVPVSAQADGSVVYDPTGAGTVAFAPVEALLGTATVRAGVITPSRKEWMEPITETPALGAIEIWEIYNFTEDAHPIHIHQVQFEVVNRQPMTIAADGTGQLSGAPVPPEPGERGTKDTVLVYPGMVTRVKMRFDLAGLFVWHCHILSHEDNEMMRPICVGDRESCEVMSATHHAGARVAPPSGRVSHHAIRNLVRMKTLQAKKVQSRAVEPPHAH